MKKHLSLHKGGAATKSSSATPWLFWGGIGAVAVGGFVVGRWLWERGTRSPRAFDRQFTGNYPRYTGAISAVTGGPPEDMNGMPAVPEPWEKSSIYDGTQVQR